MNITIQQARDLALRIFGLYCVLKLFESIPRAAYLATLRADASLPMNPTADMIAEIAIAAVYLVAGCFLLFRTDNVAHRIWRTVEPVAELQSPQPIATADFWVRLIGVYFLIWSVASIASVIWRWFPGFRDEITTSSWYAGQLIQHGVMLALAIVCIRWPEAPFRLFRPAPMSDDEVLGS